MDMGGVVAVANLRGGGEYGEAWHQAGKKAKKQNVFDDFIAAAEWLIAEKYTSQREAGDHGRLATAACSSAPSRRSGPTCSAPACPRSACSTCCGSTSSPPGYFWVDEYGSADDAEEFKTLLAYSPYHNVKPGTQLPGDADHDGRHRRPRGADAQLQVRGGAAARPVGRRADPAAHRNPRRPRRGHADHQADRPGGRPLGVFVEDAGDERAAK